MVKNLKAANELERIMKQMEQASIDLINLQYSLRTDSADSADSDDSDSDSDYSPSLDSRESFDFREFLRDDIWETNKERVECEECGSINMEKDTDCENDENIYWCEDCNCHVDCKETSENEGKNENEQKNENEEKNENVKDENKSEDESENDSMDIEFDRESREIVKRKIDNDEHEHEYKKVKR